MESLRRRIENLEIAVDVGADEVMLSAVYHEGEDPKPAQDEALNTYNAEHGATHTSENVRWLLFCVVKSEDTLPQSTP